MNNLLVSNGRVESASSLLPRLISLRLLALILCSNCSNTFNKVLTAIGGHLLNYFLKPGGSLELAQNLPCMVGVFHSHHDLYNPHTQRKNSPQLIILSINLIPLGSAGPNNISLMRCIFHDLVKPV